MNHILHDYLGKFVIVYLNDIVIYSKNIAKHIKHLNQIFSQLKQAGLKIKVKSASFAKLEIKLLSHQISIKEMISNLGKIAAIEALK